MGGCLERARAGRRALAAGLAAAGVVLAEPARADAVAASAEPVVQVLLRQGSDPIRVAGARFQPGEPGLLRNGRPTAARIALPGPVSVEGSPYRGRVTVVRIADGVRVVNEVSLEHYLEGTLLREVYPGWAPAVLRAQAVVARTYALHRMERSRGADYDLTAGADSQVYGGMEAEAPPARQAVRATRGEILVYEGAPILAAYHSASGGRTASAEEVWGRPVPYLVSLEVPGEEKSPDTYWRIPVPTATLGRSLAGLGLPVGSVREVRVVERSESGRVRRVTLRGSEGRTELDGRTLRRAAGGLPSTLFQVRREGDAFVFVGSGHGHGVGMSQWGARAMADGGASYREILARFYPGAELRHHWGEEEE